MDTGKILADLITTLIGIFIGTLAALAVDRYNQRRRKHW